MTIYKKDEYLHINILDNAGGISEELKEKIFEPYYTTKNETSSGLGLYIAKMVVENGLEGKISLKNETDGLLFSISSKIK